MPKFSFTRCVACIMNNVLLLSIVLISSTAALSLLKSPLNQADAAALLRGCTDALQRDAVATSLDEPLVPSVWLVSLRPGSSAAQVETWADAPSGSSLFLGHQVVVQSNHQLGARCIAASPAVAAQPFPPHLKLRIKDAHAICRTASVHNSSDTVNLIVRLAAASAAAMEQKLPFVLRTRTRIHSATPPSSSTQLVSMTVSVSSKQSALAAFWLISQLSIMFVQLRPTFTTHNNNAAWQLQSGVPSLLPIWQHGLRGEGQLLSVGDTGIHPDSCFFSPQVARKAVESTIRSAADGSCNVQPRLNFSAASPHPKLHAYLRYTGTDFSDVPGGHGTHVCGSASGSSSNAQLSFFNGMAPSSKLVFIDLAKDYDLMVPDDLGSDYFPCIYEAGARISSNSWGGSENYYDLYASSLDSFVHAHDDLLVLVAAGNDGANGEYTVGTPATAKNILAVGAVTSAITTDCRKCILSPNSVFFSVANSSNVYFIPASFGTDVCSLVPPAWPRQMNIYRPPAQEADACKTFETNTCADMNGQAVVLSRGTCLFVDKSLRAIACGATVVIIVNINSDNPIAMDGQGQTVSTPVFSVGRQFFSVALPISGPFINLSAFSASVIAPFSSLGPTADGRTKPDVVAPGSPIFSANALATPNSCTASGMCPSSSPKNVAAKSGTSMATPLVAGIAALIRQYLAEGFYPDGFRGSGISIYPSAALMRAFIIGSSRSTLSLTQMQRSMAPFAQDETPSFAQGWGVPVASAILPFANSTFPARSFSIKLIDRWPISATASLSAQFFVARDDSQLTVTLAWTDPASLPASDSRGMLVNDVDLLLVSPQGTLYTGNSFWSVQLAPNIVRVPLLDTVNNQEQVNVARAQVGMWGVHVRANRLSTSAQLVAVVIAGEGYYSAGAAPDRCSSWCKGTCTAADTCLCSGAQWGAACDGVVFDIPLDPMSGSYSEDVTLAVAGWRYYRFVPQTYNSELGIYMFSTSGDPDVFVSYDDSSVPDLLRNMMSDQRCDTCVVDGLYEECDRPCDDDICSSNVQGCFSKNLIQTTRAVIIGVHVSCCQPASFTIKFTGPSELFIVFRILMFVLAALALLFLIWKKRHPIVAFYRNVSSRFRRSTTRPRLPNFTNAFNFRQRVSPASSRDVVVALPALPRQSRRGYVTLADRQSTDDEEAMQNEMQPVIGSAIAEHPPELQQGRT